MTFDGWIILVTDMGAMVALSRDFQQVRTVMLNFAERGEGDDFPYRDAQEHNDWAASQTPPLRGFNWIRNPLAIDEDGGIFVASNDHMHRVIWTGRGPLAERIRRGVDRAVLQSPRRRAG